MTTWTFLTPSYSYDPDQIQIDSQYASLQQAENWLDQNWHYRLGFTIDNSQNMTSISDYQFMVQLNHENFCYSHAMSNGDDIRFTDSDGMRIYPYWIEKWNDNGNSSIWVTIPFVPFGSIFTIYMYYGNSSVDSQSAGLNVFQTLGFDDFEAYAPGSIYGQFPSATAPWQQSINNPVLAMGYGLYGFSTVVKSDSLYHMYYTGNNIVGHAISSDGVHWSIVGTALNNAVVGSAWKEDNHWFMLYRHLITQTNRYGIGLATSNDGYLWTKYAGNPVLTENNTAWFCGIEPWGIIKVNGTYYLFYNDWNSAGTQRKTGLATSTDLYHWVKDSRSPIFEDGRFCPFPFKYGDYYYLLIPHYISWDDYSTIELYRDANPTFYPEDRELVRIAANPGIPGSWNYQDQDTPFILTDNIYRNSFNVTNNQLWMYYAGAPTNQPSTWYTGLTIEPEITSAVVPVKEKPVWNYGYHDFLIVATQTHNGAIGKAAYLPAASEIQTFCDINRTRNSTVQMWMKLTNTGNMNFSLELGDSDNDLIAGIGYGMSHFSYYDLYLNNFRESNTSFQCNQWYLMSVELHEDHYNAVVYDTNYHVVFRMDELPLSSTVSRVMIRAEAFDGHSFVGFIDDFKVMGNAEGISRTMAYSVSEETCYPVNNPTIQPLASVDFVAVEGFTQSAAQNGDQIHYTISNDNGMTWYYWNDDMWFTSNQSFDEASPSQDINDHLAALPQGEGQFLWKAYLHSDGTYQVILNSISLTYSTPAPAIPENLTFQLNTNNIVLHWDAVPGAIHYRVYEAVSPNGPWLESGITNNNFIERSLSATEGQKFFKVTAE